MDRLTTAARFEGWIPIRVFWRDGVPWVDWCYLGQARFTAPFFRDSINEALRLPFNQAFRRETPIEVLAELRDTRPALQPTAFIYHASRCGSTLASQMLAALDSHIAISEPPMLDTLLRARIEATSIDEGAQVEWIRGLLAALGQPRNGEKAFVVKLDAWNIFDLALMRKAFPETPWIYLYRDPLEIAESQMRERGRYMIPGMLGAVEDVIGPDAGPGIGAEEFVARLVGRMLEAGHAGCRDHGGIALHYDRLPQALWTTLRERLGIADDPGTLETLRTVAQRDAKHPQIEFTADSRDRRAQASGELRALVDRWAMPAYQALEHIRSSRSP